MSPDRSRRRRRILEIVASRPVHTQEELAEALGREGWEVTQSSVSRDIAALKLAKLDGVYRRPAVPPVDVENVDERHIAESVTGVDEAGDVLIVMHTPPGEANRVGISLDRLAWPEVAGTIAGDDTIFIAARDANRRRSLRRKLRRLLGGG